MCCGCCAPHGENSCTGFHHNTATDESVSPMKVQELHKHRLRFTVSRTPLDRSRLILFIQCYKYRKEKKITGDIFVRGGGGVEITSYCKMKKKVRLPAPDSLSTTYFIKLTKRPVNANSGQTSRSPHSMTEVPHDNLRGL